MAKSDMNSARKLLAANWKMNLDLQGARVLATEVVHTLEQELRTPLPIVLAPAFPLLQAVHHLTKDHARFGLAAQDLSSHAKGAYTGEVAGTMLHSVGCRYVIIGHSERRQYYKETEALLALKIEQARLSGLTPIFCLGETLENREAGAQKDVVTAQLKAVMPALADIPGQIILAYEPVWAIGTGRTASPEQAQEMHALLRGLLNKALGSERAENTPLLYGGSLNATNAAPLFAQPDVDGGLVGGASLKAREFAHIALALANA